MKDLFLGFLASLFLLAFVGCSLPTGPSKLFHLVGKTATENIILFEATVADKCVPLFAVPNASAAVNSQTSATVGCLLPVRVDVESQDRKVFCPAGELLSFCQGLRPLSTRISFKGIANYGGDTIFFPETLKKKEF